MKLGIFLIIITLLLILGAGQAIIFSIFTSDWSAATWYMILQAIIFGIPCAWWAKHRIRRAKHESQAH